MTAKKSTQYDGVEISASLGAMLEGMTPEGGSDLQIQGIWDMMMRQCEITLTEGEGESALKVSKKVNQMNLVSHLWDVALENRSAVKVGLAQTAQEHEETRACITQVTGVGPGEPSLKDHTTAVGDLLARRMDAHDQNRGFWQRLNFSIGALGVIAGGISLLLNIRKGSMPQAASQPMYYPVPPPHVVAGIPPIAPAPTPVPEDNGQAAFPWGKSAEDMNNLKSKLTEVTTQVKAMGTVMKDIHKRISEPYPTTASSRQETYVRVVAEPEAKEESPF